MKRTIFSIIKISGIALMLIFIANITLGQAASTLAGPQPQGSQPVTPTPAPSNQQVATAVPVQPAGISSLATVTPLPEVNKFSNTAQFTFSDIEQPTFVMTYPSITEIYFRLPAQWELKGENYITLHYDLVDDYSSPPGSATGVPQNRSYLSPELYAGYRASLVIYVNELYAASFSPISGNDNYYTFPIPSAASALRTNPTNEYFIRLEYVNDRDPYCLYNGILTIKDDSNIKLNFSPVVPALDLGFFPAPLVQNSFLPETLYVIVPDNPTDNDLSTAAIVSGLFGKNAGANLRLELIRASQATRNLLSNSSFIVVGRPDKNTFLQSLYKANIFSTSYGGGNIINNSTLQPIPAGDGILQIAASPFNPYNSVLAITGSTDEAVLLAAQSLGSQTIGQEGFLSIIKEGSLPPKPKPLSDVVTLKDLGYVERPIYGIGDRTLTFAFYIPRNWEMQDGQQFVMNFANSDNLDQATSSIALYLNGRPISSTVIDTRRGDKQVVFPINKQDLIVGSANFLRIEIISASNLICHYRPRSFWVSVRDTSWLNLPHTIVTEPDAIQPLSHPLYYLAFQPDVLFSMPPKPTDLDLRALANLSRLLGQIGAPYFNFKVTQDPNFDFRDRSDMNVVIFGRPSTNPQIARLNDALPQPFVEGEDSLKQEVNGAVYRLPASANIGVVEVLSAPWNKLAGVTLVSGTSEQGYQWAVDKATRSDFLGDFFGDVVFVGETTVRAYRSFVLNIALERVGGAVTGTQMPLETVQATQAATSVSPVEPYVPTSQPKAGGGVTTYVLYGLLGIGLIILILAAIQTARGGRRS
ncbi:MAG: cellulose biosynthesis cyclic di-GMP-binding regulatory protein BcsB [Anaerolineales bacterium]